MRYQIAKFVSSRDGSTFPFDPLFAVPPHKCPQAVVDAGLTDQTGWVPVDPGTMQKKFESVYAVGDVTSVPTPSGYMPYLPKAGAFAHGQAEVVAHNLAVEIGEKGTKKVWNGGGSPHEIECHGDYIIIGSPVNDT